MSLKKIFRFIVVGALLIISARQGWAENCCSGNMKPGIMQNPMLWADVPDPDVIRVGEDFYMVSTTMHLMPGCPVMHSKDLVNWETIGYVFDKLTDTPKYDLIDGKSAYGRGQWATSIRYRDGVYYILFSPNDQPYKSYIYKATNPAGPWQLHARSDHFHDASLLLDDDGKAYVFYGSGDIRLRQLNDDLSGTMDGGLDKVVITPDAEAKGLHEGSRVIKHNGKYYAFVINWPAGKPRCQLCYRADKIEGPYEKMKVLESEFGGFSYVGQGCLVDDQFGDWWGVIFQDRGGVGRVLTLNPCTWKDGWPILGDSEGKVPATIEKKVSGEFIGKVAESDDFEDGKKSIFWQWNHNPVDSAWSLTQRPGYLRLHTARLAGNLYEAPNTISQRMTGPYSSGIVKLDVSGMCNGDRAGFAAMNGDSGLLQIECSDSGKCLVAKSSSVELENPSHRVSGVKDMEMTRVPLLSDEVYLKITTDFMPGRDMAKLCYSYDGDNWQQIGEDFKMIFDYTRFFMGTRFAIFNYATDRLGGHIDVDYFRYEDSPNKPELYVKD